MPEYCTCGAKLVDDARFCHRCGRPTRDEEIIEVAAAPPPPAPTAAQRLSQLPLTFGNPIVLRIGFLISMVILLLVNTVVQLAFVWWLAAGWGAVLWYRRVTGSSLSVSAGARLGSITGVMVFVALLIEVAIQILLAGKQILDEAMKKDPRVSQMLNDPTLFSVGIFFSVAFGFILVVGFCAAGGALGARFNMRRNSA